MAFASATNKSPRLGGREFPGCLGVFSMGAYLNAQLCSRCL